MECSPTATHCILDATLPIRRYVATVQLKRVTDGERTFWHWQSTFDAPPGRERELADLVGTGVYEGGFNGLRAYLRRPRHASSRAASASGSGGAAAGSAMAAQGVVVSAFGGPDVLAIRHGRRDHRDRARCASARRPWASTTSTSTCARACTG